MCFIICVWYFTFSIMFGNQSVYERFSKHIKSPCLPVCLPTWLSACLSTCLTVCLSVYMSDSLSVFDIIITLCIERVMKTVNSWDQRDCLDQDDLARWQMDDLLTDVLNVQHTSHSHIHLMLHPRPLHVQHTPTMAHVHLPHTYSAPTINTHCRHIPYLIRD